MVGHESVQTQMRESICSLEKNSGTNNDESLLSPGFKSVAAMAGWDEEALLLATLIVEDTPEREVKHKRRIGLQLKTPPTNSRRKRRNQRRSPNSIPIVALDLDEEETVKEESKNKKTEITMGMKNDKEENKDELMPAANPGPCMDKLREELSCAICLEICYEPSTTPCGHSFCKKCLKSCADRCGKKCPKCRQLISNGRACTVNTVLWNTIQILFPQQIESRKAAAASKNREEDDHHSPRRTSDTRNRNIQPIRASSRAASHRRREVSVLARDDRNDHEDGFQVIRATREANDDGFRFLRSSRSSNSSEARRTVPSQDTDAALALRLQREEFMVAFRGGNEQSQGSVSMARANLRAMASRAMTVRLRGHRV